MLQDVQGLAVTTDSHKAIAAIDHFAEQLLSYGKHPDVIFEGIEADPESVLVNAHAAALCLFAEKAEAYAEATHYLNAAKAHLATATEREQLYVAAIDAWAQGEIEQALAAHQVLADGYPRDLVSVQIGQYHTFNLGNSRGLLQLIEKVFPANQENHYVHGMLAFGLEQCHCLTEAEAAGRQAAEMNRQDPWAHHAVAHVMQTQGRLREGINWMESFSETWESCGSFFTHNWWHVALYYLDLEDFSKVLDLLDSKIWGRAAKDYSQCQLDTISLLLRLELRGVDVRNRWQSVTPYFKCHIYEHIQPFIDVQYIYALARSGQREQADEMLESIRAYAETAKPCVQSAWMEVALPTARGMVAHAQGDWSAAATHLRSTLPRMHQIGGSHAQRDLFEQVYLDALIQAKQYSLAHDLLEKRDRTCHHIPAIYREFASSCR